MHRLTLFCRLVVGLLLALPIAASAQPVEPPNGPRRVHPNWHALTGATVIPAPGERMENATIVLRDGVIVAIGPDLEPPAGARVWSCEGMTIYPALIDPYVTIEVPAPDDDAPGRHWNTRILAERSALDGGGLDGGGRERLRGMGFAVAGIAPDNGIFRGSTAVVSLGDPVDDTTPYPGVLARDVFHTAALERGGFRDPSYPGSKMGAIALMRQTLADVTWHARATSVYARDGGGNRPAPSAALDALAVDLPLLFDVSDELDAIRVAKIAREFERPFALVGSGTEFRRLDAIARLGVDVVLPLAFTDKPDVATPAERASTSLRTLMMWEQAPTNPRRLADAGVRLSLTTGKLPDDQSFWTNLRSAIKHGLSEDDALAMLTTHPAALLGLDDRVGRLAAGMSANLVVVEDGELFDKDRTLRSIWVDGRRYELKADPAFDLEGTWDASLDAGVVPFAVTLKISSKNKITLEREAPEVEENADEAGDDGDAGSVDTEPKKKSIRVRNASVHENRIAFVVNASDLELGDDGVVLMSAVIEGEDLHGQGVRPDGSLFDWSVARQPADDAEADAEDADADDDAEGEEGDEEAEDESGDDDDADALIADIPESWGLPFGAYGLMEVPRQEDVVFTNATIWTSGPDGVIEDGALHIRKGRIVQVGPESRLSGIHGATRIDLGGRHITPGLIDCHSHTGISGGVNEGTQSATAEVRIFDVIDPDSINWYRELAGGLTAANQLHGSANAIGGQNSVVKLRWGCEVPDDMRLKGAPGGIKFALGENVKQSNWGDDFTTRYPQTRMGVEAFIRDRFTAARDYAKAMAAWDDLSAGAQRAGVPPRRDLELEALAEILAGDRLIHCHSYRQDEILMLCRIAGEFGFRIGTFQHVLEGYKVADAIRDHAIGGSSFSDWWAYKFEVYDAIPYNGALMHEVGVVVSFNSDSDELARRMNTEAAKAVRYGGVSPEEALKFVTLNPAIQLGIEERVGSLEKGKDADFAIWSGPPLSTLSRCEETWVDGRKYFSIERDAELREQAAAERTRLIQKVLADKDASGGDGASERGGREGRPGRRGVDSPPLLHPLAAKYGFGGSALGDGDPLTTADHLAEYLDWLRMNGLDASVMHPGDCGCAIHNLTQE